MFKDNGSFDKDLHNGLQWEKDCIAKLSSLSAFNWSMPSPNQHYGDYWFMTKAGTRRFLEIKSDTYCSNNFALELWSTQGVSYGWANPKDERYKYDLMCIYQPFKKRIVFFTNSYAKQFVEEHLEDSNYGWVADIKNSKAQCFMVNSEKFVERLKEYGDSYAKVIDY